jgi:hypothetical protein
MLPRVLAHRRPTRAFVLLAGRLAAAGLVLSAGGHRLMRSSLSPSRSRAHVVEQRQEKPWPRAVRERQENAVSSRMPDRIGAPPSGRSLPRRHAFTISMMISLRTASACLASLAFASMQISSVCASLV